MAHEMSDSQLLDSGKIGRELFDRVIFPRLGAHRSDVLVGPRHGVDIGIVDAGNGQAMAVTTDPFFIVPEYGWQRAAWFAVQIVASDAATSGLRPAYLTVDLNLPRSMSDGELCAMWEGVHSACAELGIAVVTGHTGRYDNCDFPMIGGATVIAMGSRSAYVTPEMAQCGDAVVVTKGPAIETTGLFGVTFPDILTERLGPETTHAAGELFWEMSVVRDAIVAVEIGVRDAGVTAMHDATERGVLGGLLEIAEAAGTGMVVDLDAILIRPEVRAVCDLFEMDPYLASSEGTLLLTCRPHRLSALLDRLSDVGIDAFLAGEIRPASEGVSLMQRGRERTVAPPGSDPFWPAYRRARGAGL